MVRFHVEAAVMRNGRRYEDTHAVFIAPHDPALECPSRNLTSDASSAFRHKILP